MSWIIPILIAFIGGKIARQQEESKRGLIYFFAFIIALLASPIW